MAVDTNFTALFDKLKVEDPWLPPRAWESIPSQSGPLPVHHSNISTSSCSSVSEASLVRLAVNALQGVQSAITCVEKISAAFCSDPADRTFLQVPSLWNRSSSTNALGNMLKSIGRSGFLVLLLHKFVEHFVKLNGNPTDHQLESYKVGGNQDRSNNEMPEDQPRFSLVNQAFAVSVGKVLEGYTCALDTLHASVCLRRSSNGAESMSSPSSGCLTNVVQLEISLLEVYLHSKELRTQIETLGTVCNLYDLALGFSVSSTDKLIAEARLAIRKFYVGGDLLTYLYAQLKVADPSHSALLKFLFLRSCEPYCGFIRSWIFKAEINDPYGEFMVESVQTLQFYSDDKAAMSRELRLLSVRLRGQADVPCFLKDVLVPLVRAGQQLQVLLKLLELRKNIVIDDVSYTDFLPCWSGFSGNAQLYASPITFSQRSIERLVLMRSQYYSGMQEKLENLLEKLEFNHAQGSLQEMEPLLVDNSKGIFYVTTALTVDTELSMPYLADQKISHVTSDDASGMEDEYHHRVDTMDSSDCSSTVSSEDETQSDQETAYSSGVIEPKANFLSALSFSVTTPVANCSKISAQLASSQNGGEILSDLDLLNPDNPHSSNKCYQLTESLPEKKWLSSGLPLLFSDYNQVYQEDTELYPSGRARKIRHGKVDDDGLYLMTQKEDDKHVFNHVKNSLFEETSSDGQFTNGFDSNLSAVQLWKLNWNSNFFSRNPMLMRNSLFPMISRPHNVGSSEREQHVPFFNFSSVNDPFKICLEKLGANSRFEAPGDFNTLAKYKSCKNGKPDNRGNSILVNSSRVSHAQCPVDLKRYNGISTIVSGGSSWATMLDSSRLSDSCTIKDEQDLGNLFEMPLDFIIDKCLLQEISLQYNYVSKLTIKLLEEGFDLQEHLLALRRYHFVELADWADLFIVSLSRHKWYVTEGDQRVSEIQGLLELSIQRSSCNWDPYKDRLVVFMKESGIMPLSTSAVGIHSLDFLGLGYRVNWPVSIILTPDALKIYANIFNFLLRLKVAHFSLTEVWRSLEDLIRCRKRDLRMQESDVGHVHTLMKFRHQVNHFVSTLQQYVHSQLSHVSWCRFLHSLKNKVKDMMDIELVHMAYLTDSMDICFLSEKTRPIASIIESILQCALDLRSCLTETTWDIGLIKDSLQDHTSRVNISQVFAIKQKFTKNLKELQLCYLRSPKHGSSGLSCFWGYLNFNDYYLDGNAFSLSAFTI